MSGEINQVADEKEAAGWVKIEAVIDGGAVDNTLPAEMFPSVPATQNESSLAGTGFRGAGGERIDHYGEKTLSVKTAEGQTRKVKWQVCKVRRALMPVSRITAAGNTEHMSPNNPHIVNHKTKQVTKITKRGNVYVVDLGVRGPPKPPTATTARRQNTTTWTCQVSPGKGAE